MKVPSIWTDENEALLERLWLAGETGGLIAARIAGATRCGVLGKVYRMGLTGRQPKLPRAQQKRKRRQAYVPAPITLANGTSAPAPNKKDLPYLGTTKRMPMPKILSDKKTKHSIADVAGLTRSTCRWPVGDVGHDDFHFCGRTPQPGGPYCPGHNARAHVPYKRRIRDRVAA